MLSVCIPVFNGGTDLERCLAAVARQRVDEPTELVVVDSSSTDGSAEVARRHGARVHTIAQAEFNHGGTRNLLAELATGDVLVFLSQDAFPERDDWLATLTQPLRTRPEVAGSYGRQVAHEDASPPERFFLDFLYGPRSRDQRASSPRELTMDTTLFSNVNAAMHKDAWAAHPFPSDVIMSEDQVWSQQTLLDGQTLAYVAEAVVRHSHPYTIAGAFKRFFDSGVSAEASYLAGGDAAEQAVLRNAARYARAEVGWLLRRGHARWLPYAAVYELAKFAGLQLGMRHEALPAELRPRLSALPSYWRTPNRATSGAPSR